MTALRVAWRIQRFELVVLVGGCLALAAAIGIVAVQASTTQAELAACYRTAPDSSAIGWPCRGIDAALFQLGNLATVFAGIATTAPFLAGIFLGTPLVAREIERGTASIAWSLAPSRAVWLIRRVLPTAGFLVVALLVLGYAAEAAFRATTDGLDMRHFGMVGPQIAARGAAVFAIGLLIGLAVGRSLVAILLTAAVVAALFMALHFARYELMRAESVWIDPTETGFSFDYVHESGFRDGDGAIIGFDEAFERYPEAFTEEGDQVPPGMTMVTRVNPPDQLSSFVAREVGVLAAVAFISFGASVVAIQGRRPV